MVLLSLENVSEAHFRVATNIRVLHVEHTQDGIRIHMRIPMPLLVADLLGPKTSDGQPEPAPFTSNEEENGQLVHYLNLDEVMANPNGLGRLAADKHVFIFKGKRTRGEVESVRVWPALRQSRFVSLDEVQQSFSQTTIYPPNTEPGYVGDTVVDVQLVYRIQGPVSGFMFASQLGDDIPSLDTLANLIIDHVGPEPRIYRMLGPVADLVQIGDVSDAERLHEIPEIEETVASPIQDAYRFTVEGVRHILAGVDHVLFVLCLIIGASGLRPLIYRVSGFTIGHTITLVAGFFGFVPSGAWFIPTVELGIALSIVYAAIIAMADRAHVSTFFVTTAIGLLHGLGFSFVLHELLKVDSPNLWVSLISFNIGVEIGQLFMVLIIWPAFVFGLKHASKSTLVARNMIASAAILVSLYWCYQRASVVGSVW